jgi:hypothetical protein
LRRKLITLGATVAGIGLAAASSAAVAIAKHRTDDGGLSLAWAPPALSNPISIDVTNANRQLRLDDSRDYRLRIVEPLERELWIEGGRNVVVVGGHVTIDELGASNAYRDNTAVKIRFGNPAGTVHVEGLLIDGPFVSDAIAVATGRTVQIENVRIERTRHGIKGQHGDCLQIQQGAGALRIDHFTCTTEQQGLFLDDSQGRTGAIDIRNTDIVGDPGKVLFFQTTASTGPVTLRNVWLHTDRPWAPLGFWVYPTVAGAGPGPAGTGVRRAVVSSARGDRPGVRQPQVSFVNTRISGRLFGGHPPSHDFVPAGVAGLDYVSPSR